MARKSKTAELWPELLEHISETWQKKKGRKYPFMGQDLKLLKNMTSWLTSIEIMALWDCYLRSSEFWGPKTGFLVSGMFSERSILLDNSSFKSLVSFHEKRLGLREQKELWKELTA